MAAASSTSPHVPPIAHAPKLMLETSKPVRPSALYCMAPSYQGPAQLSEQDPAHGEARRDADEPGLRSDVFQHGEHGVSIQGGLLASQCVTGLGNQGLCFERAEGGSQVRRYF